MSDKRARKVLKRSKAIESKRQKKVIKQSQFVSKKNKTVSAMAVFDDRFLHELTDDFFHLLVNRGVPVSLSEYQYFKENGFFYNSARNSFVTFDW